MWITLDQLECLEAVNIEGSITGAAERLNRAKSAVHYAIKNLEEQVGFKIVDTEAYRGKLTPKGTQFLKKAKVLLEQTRDLKDQIHQIAKGVEAQLCISSTALYSLKKITKKVSSIQNEFPNTEIIFHREILSGERMLLQKMVDIAIIEKSERPKGYQCKKIDEIEMNLVIAKNHPFLKSLKKDELFKYPQIIQRSTIPDDDQAGVFQESRRWTVGDLNTKKELILSGLGWGRLPHHEVDREINKGSLIHLTQIEKPLQVPVYIARLKGEYGQVSQKFWDLF